MKKLVKFQFKSITHRLIFSCVVSAIAIYSISYWHGRYLVQRNVRSWIIDLSQSRIDNAAHQIEGSLLRLEKDVFLLRQTIQESAQNFSPSQTEILPQLKFLLAQQPHIQVIALVNIPSNISDTSNRGWQYDRQGGYKNITSEATVLLDRCQRDRKSLINPNTNQSYTNQSFWTELYFLNNHEKPRITYCIPLAKKSDITANSAIAIEMNLDWLSDFMKQKLANSDETHYLELGDLFVTIASNKPDRQWLIKPNNPQQIQAWLSQRKMSPQNASPQNKNLDSISSNQQPINSQPNSLTDSQGTLISQTVNSTGWIVGIGIPVGNFEKASQQYLWLMILSMSRDMGLICVVIAFISQITTRSLRDLNISTEEMAKGNLDTILPSITSEDEVGRLAQSFRRMRDSLQLYIQDLQETTAAKQKLESELSIAAQIQRTMLPRTNVDTNLPYDISAVLKPARIVGGDLYDFFLMGSDRLCLIIGDVADKGFPSALQMARTITLIRTLTKANSTPSQILSAVNQELCVDNEECQFVTVFCGVLELGSGDFTYTSGGHDAPILVRDRHVQHLELETMPPLGIYEDATFEEHKFKLVANDLILFYTDGITEAMNLDGEFFSDTRLIEMIAAYPPTNTTRAVRTIQHFCQQFVGDAPQFDDMTLLAMQYLPSSPFLQVSNVMEWNLTLNSELTELENVKQSLNKILDNAGLAVELIENTQLIVEEILVNIIQYGYENRNDGHIDLRLEINKQYLIMTFKDGGKPFNPLIEVAAPDLDRDDDERSLGGFGFFLVQELSDQVDYTYCDGKNILTVSQLISS
jgi:sigma-B regulation protein RsbU (phosphoserine phosphatase)